MGAFDELLSAWRSNPDAESTLALCNYLGAHPHEDIVREVGVRSEQWHAADPAVMLAVGRMYLDAGLLTEAQAALVGAGKANSNDSRPFRFLGEVLLRRGDALRAEKVLTRAIELGARDAELGMMRDRAVVYVALQKRVGMQAVAAEVARTLPRQTAVPLPVPPPAPPARPPPRRPPPPRPPWTGDEAPTLPQSARLGLGARPPAVALTPPPSSRARPAPPAYALTDEPTAVMSSESLHDAQRRSFAPDVAGDEQTEVTIEQPMGWLDRASERPGPAVAPRTPLGGFAAQAAATAAAPAYAPPVYAPPASSRRVPHSQLELEDSFEPIDDHVAEPTPELVLENLARVGLYEPGGGAAPAWEKPPASRSRGNWVFVLASLLLLAAGSGGWYYARDVKQKRVVHAQTLGDEVEVMLRGGNPDELRASDDKLAKIFDLDSRSQRAARLWLENRVLQALLLTDEPRGIDAAVHRGLTVGLEEKDVAFGKIAAFLVEGDVAGAAALLPKYDKLAEKDAFYHLAAGAVLERAGDLRAIERYEAARALDDELVAADVLLTRAVLLELGIDKGRQPLAELERKIGDTPTRRALSALAWAVDPERARELPKNALLHEQERSSLIGPLRPVPYVVDALQAINAGYEEKAAGAIASAIELSVSPGMATQLGFLALKAGNEKLARSAALRALQFSALYPQARVLASRVALLGGRLDEAKKAIEELEPRSPEVAVVRAVLAYETLDAGELSSAVDALGEAARLPDYAALAAARGVLAGDGMPPAEKLQVFASPQVPWGEILAVDTAIQTGDLELAEKLVADWGEGATRPVYALRVSRLRRHQGKLDEAAAASHAALEQGTSTLPVITERAYVLIAKQDFRSARELIARYPSLLGLYAGWLKGLIEAESGHPAEAKVQLAQLELPPVEAPLEIRLLAMRALVAGKDKRAKPALQQIARQVPGNPELVAAKKKK
jgi:hypothetical protein